MNASTLVDLLLELNIVNVKDVDNEINKLAAKVSDPRAQKWFRRVPRFFLINIDRLLKEPYVAKAEPRGIQGSKYYADPRGGWVAGRQPGQQPGSPLPVREQYDPEKQTYTTALHEPAVQKDIEQSFTQFKPAKAKAKDVFGAPPTKKQLQPWMTAPGSQEKEFYHFDPIQTRRRELFSRLTNLVHHLNYQHSLILKAKSGDEMDDRDRANAEEAEKLMRKLEVMKTDDIEGFRDILKHSSDFMQTAKEKPWLFTQDGRVLARSGNLTLRKIVYPQTAVAMARRPVDQSKWTDISHLFCPAHQSSGCVHEGVRWPIWCTKSESYANNYLNNPAHDTPVTGAALYHIDKNDIPYVLAHFPTHQVYNPYDRGLDEQVTNEIAPLFVDERHFPLHELAHGAQSLANAVERLRRGRR